MEMNGEVLSRYKELDIYYPRFDTLELRCTNLMIPRLHQDVTMSLAGPLTRHYGLTPSHDRIIGSHAADGMAWHDPRFTRHIGTFVFRDGEYTFYDEMPEDELRELM